MDKLQQIKLPIDKEFEEFRRLFDSSLQSSNSLLSEVLSYIKQRNGKMMRPILALLIAKLFGEINDSTLHAALSLSCSIRPAWCTMMWWMRVTSAVGSLR